MEDFNWIRFFNGASKVRLPGESWQVINYIMAENMLREGDCSCRQHKDPGFNIKAMALAMGMARTSVSRAIMLLKARNVLEVSTVMGKLQLRHLKVKHPEEWILPDPRGSRRR